MRFGKNVRRMTWNERFVQFSWKPHCFTFGENFRPVWRIWELWRSQMRFGQNVLRMSWNERFVQFSSKAHCFPVLQRIWGQCDDFENFDAHKCDLAKTCCSWPKKRVLYNFHGKRTVFPFSRDLRSVWRFWQIWPSQMQFGQNVLRMTWKEGFVQFLWKAHCFLVLERIWGQCDDFDNFDPHKCDLAKTCCAWPETSVLYNFYRKPHCFPRLARISGQCDHFENFDAQKCDLAKTCCAWPIKNVLYNFIGKRTVFRVSPVSKRIWDKCNDFQKFDP